MTPAPVAAIPVLPVAVVPVALSAHAIHSAAATPAKPGLPGEQPAPKTALEGLKTELNTPKPDDSDLAGGRGDIARLSPGARALLDEWVASGWATGVNE